MTQLRRGTPGDARRHLDDRFDANDSVVVCPLTTDPTSAPTFRLVIGRLGRAESTTLNRALIVFLGLA